MKYMVTLVLLYKNKIEERFFYYPDKRAATIAYEEFKKDYFTVPKDVVDINIVLSRRTNWFVRLFNAYRNYQTIKIRKLGP